MTADSVSRDQTGLPRRNPNSARTRDSIASSGFINWSTLGPAKKFAYRGRPGFGFRTCPYGEEVVRTVKLPAFEL